MIIFNELRITEDGGCIVVDCEIEGVDIYKDMYITSVYLEYYKNANAASMPSGKAYCLYENKTDDQSIRAVRLSFPKTKLPFTNFGVNTLDGGLFYVIVNCDGHFNGNPNDYPCRYDETTKIGAVLDWKLFYDRGMNYVVSLFSGCDPCPDYSAFEHFAVLWNALKMALSTCDWNLVADLWDKFLLAPEGVVAPAVSRRGGCGCR